MTGQTPLAGGLIGQLAVSRGLITPEQLRQCLELHGRSGNQRLGDLLVMQGLISGQQLQELLAEQTSVQQQQRQTGPMGAQPADPAKVQQDLLVVQGNALDPRAGAPVARVNVARKSAAEIEAEKKKAAAKKKRPADTDGGLDLELPDADPGAFEIEIGGNTRTIEKTETTPARGIAKATEAAASPWGEDGLDLEGAKGGASPEPKRVVTAAAPPYDPLSTAGGKTIAELVVAAARAMASDLHLHTGYPLVIRQSGRIVASPGAPLTRAQLEPALNDLLPPDRRRAFAEAGQIETSLAIPNVGRCRVQLTMAAEGPSAVLRIVPPTIPALTALGLPGTIARFVTTPGLVLLAGPSGCGKTWTLAALVDIVNAERREHIVCVEKPIEFLHPSKRCVVSQREVPTHASSVARAVRAALHEDPDVLVIGEIDDAETLLAAMTAAEGGRLVLATIAAANATRAVARAIGLFPAESQALAAATLADTLRAVVAQRLVPMADGVRRVAITEVFDVDPETATKIAAADVASILPKSTFDQALSAAVRAGTVTREEARRHAERPEPFS